MMFHVYQDIQIINQKNTSPQIYKYFLISQKKPIL